MPRPRSPTLAELTVDHVDVRFGGVQALRDVQLSVRPGHVTGLIGPNGAGKTTLFNVVSGLLPPTRGSLRLAGRDITRLAPHARARLGVARTFQRLEVCGTLTARENIQLALEARRARRSRSSSSRAEANALLAKVGALGVADEPADALPTGTARLVEVARALAIAPSVLLLDEPSAGLDRTETHALGELLRAVANDGVAVLLVEHDMSLVMSACQMLYVLDYGQVIAHGDPATVRGDPAVQAAYLGTTTAPRATPANTSSPTQPAKNASSGQHRGLGEDARPAAGAEFGDDAAAGDTPGPPALAVHELRAAYGRLEVLHGVTLEVPQGAVLALLGPNGAGKSTLLKVLSGRLKPTAGSVRVDGSDLGRARPDRLARNGLCAVPEGRGIFPNLTVAENLRMCTYLGSGSRASDLEERALTHFPALKGRRSQLAGTLSGGEQQMVALARAVCTRPRTLLLDEISMGLAPIVVAQLYEGVAELVRAEQLTVLVVEQFAETALRLATRAAIMVNGRIATSGRPQEVAAAAEEAYLGQAAAAGQMGSGERAAG